MTSEKSLKSISLLNITEQDEEHGASIERSQLYLCIDYRHRWKYFNTDNDGDDRQ